MSTTDHGLEVLKKSAEFYLANPNELLLRVKDYDALTLLNSILVALGGSSSTTTTASITNVLVASANVEQTFSLPSNCKGFLIKARQICRMRIAYNSGETSTNWVSVGLGGFFVDDNFYTSQNIYYQVDRANTDVEIITYV